MELMVRLGEDSRPQTCDDHRGDDVCLVGDGDDGDDGTDGYDGADGALIWKMELFKKMGMTVLTERMVKTEATGCLEKTAQLPATGTIVETMVLTEQ